MNIQHPLTQRLAILASIAAVFAIGPVAEAANNTFNGTGTSWNAGGSWSTGLTPASSDALLINSSSLASGTNETIDNSFSVQTLSFDTGSSNINIKTNASATTAQTLTLSGGTDALGNVSSIDLSPTATGTINLGTASGVGTLTVSLSSTDAINISNAAAMLNIGAVVAGSSGLTLAGAGTLVLTGANTYTGGTKINGGTLQVGNGAVNGTIGSGTYSIASGATLRIDQATQTAPTWSNFTGAGTLDIFAANATSAGLHDWGSVALASGFTGKFLVEDGRTYFTSPSQLGGATSIQINSGAQILPFSGTYTQSITIAGTGSESDYAGAIRFANGSSGGWSGNITLAANAMISSQGDTESLTGAIGGGYQLELSSVGTSGASTFTLTPSVASQNSYGSTLIDSSVTAIAGNQYAFSTGGMTVNGTLELNNNSFSFANLSGAGTVENNGSTSAATLTVGSDGSSTTFSGSVVNGGSQALALAKTGTGTLILTHANTYSGATTVQSGELNIQGAQTGAGAVSITGGELLLSGAGSVNSSTGITVNGSGAKFVQTSSAAVTPGVTLTQGIVDGTGTINTVTVADLAGNTVQNGNGGTGKLTIGNLIFNGAGTLNVNDGNVVTVPGLNVTGALTTGAVNQGGLITLTVADPSGWTSGNTYDLVNFGSLVADGTAANDNFLLGTISNLTPRQSATLVITGTELGLQIAGDSPKWTGLDNNNWVVGSTGPNHNWKLITEGTPTDYISGDQVTFDDSASSGIVNISAANVTPSTTTFNNNALNYTLEASGSYGIASGGFVKSGTGTLTIQNVNTFTAPTLINGGIVDYSNAGGFGTYSPITVAAGATAQIGGGVASTGTNNVTLSGAGAANATGALESLSGSNSSATPIVLAANSTVSIDAGALTLSGVISGSGFGLTKGGAGTLILTGTNTFSGPLTINSGIVATNSIAGTSAAQGIGESNIVNLNGGTLRFTTGNLTGFNPALNIGAGGGTLDMSAGFILSNAALSGSGTLTIANSGNATNSWLLITSDNSAFTGNIVIGNGGVTTSAGIQVRTSAAAPLGSGTISINTNGLLTADTSTASIANNIVLNGGLIQSQTINFTLTGGVVLQANSFTGGPNSGGTSLFFTGIISGTGGLTNQDGQVTVFQGANTYSGLTSIKAGTLSLQNSLALQDSTLSMDGGSIVFHHNAVNPDVFTLGGLSGANNLGLVDDSGTAVALTVGNNNTNTTYSGVLSGSGASLTKVGSGTLTLSKSNTYTGATTVSGGTLIVAGSISGSPVNVNGGILAISGSLSSSQVNVAGGTLAGGSFTGILPNVVGNVIVGTGSGAAESSIVAPSAGGGVAAQTVLNIQGNLTLNSDAAYQFQLNSGEQGYVDQMIVSGTMTLGSGAMLAGFDIGGISLAPGTEYTLIDAESGIIGSFANSTVQVGPNLFDVSYVSDGDTGTYVELTSAAIPEPQTWATIFIGIAMLVGLQRTRRGGRRA